MMRSGGLLWLAWSALFATLLGWLVLPSFGPHYADPWYEAQAAVAVFVFAILSMVAGVGSFAMRESLVLRDVREQRIDPSTEQGRVQLTRRLVALWTLCALIGVLGALLAYYTDEPRLGWPYLGAAGVLLVIHAPRARFLRSICDG
jgi:peptidoglycan/LPS O-acetylase OafA/YrhL